MINKPTPTTLHSLPFNGLRSNTDRLDSWKEIAVYLRREVRTVQMWEKHEGLPVHRHFHSRRSTVFAFRSEIESWAKRRTAIAASAKAAAEFVQPAQAA